MDGPVCNGSSTVLDRSSKHEGSYVRQRVNESQPNGTTAKAEECSQNNDDHVTPREKEIKVNKYFRFTLWFPIVILRL